MGNINSDVDDWQAIYSQNSTKIADENESHVPVSDNGVIVNF